MPLPRTLSDLRLIPEFSFEVPRIYISRGGRGIWKIVLFSKYFISNEKLLGGDFHHAIKLPDKFLRNGLSGYEIFEDISGKIGPLIFQRQIAHPRRLLRPEAVWVYIYFYKLLFVFNFIAYWWHGLGGVTGFLSSDPWIRRNIKNKRGAPMTSVSEETRSPPSRVHWVSGPRFLTEFFLSTPGLHKRSI